MCDSKPPASLGVLLAGGLARRMGGGDKPLRTVGGRTILDRAIAALRPQCAALILNANGDATRFASTGLPVVPDSVPGFAGPLAGVLAGLDWCAQHHADVDWVVTVAADSPFLPDDLVSRLHEARMAAGMPMAQAESNGRSHPVNALWPIALREDLRRTLVEEEQRKVGAFGARHGVSSAVWSSDPVDPFFNANAPEDVEEADRLAQRYGL
jgi:molybdopterin-guanine dinucleotide biosynthesis protein A